MILGAATTKDGRKLILREAVPDDAAALVKAVDAVSRERRFFLRSRFEPDVEVEGAWLAQTRRRGDLILLGMLGKRLIGWVTLLRQAHEFRRHASELGIGVLREYRGLGVGWALMTATLEWAAKNHVERVELSVRASNIRARRLYESLGFVQEGYRTRSVKDDRGAYHDDVLMALLL